MTAINNIETPYTVDLKTGDPESKRYEILTYFQQTYETYEKLFEPFTSEEAFTERADPLRHPLIFYYGHTATFFVNKLIMGKFLKERVEPQFENTFAIGVDEMSWDDLNEAHYEWPKSSQVKAYRDRVRKVIEQIILESPMSLPVTWDSVFWVIMMGIEHERIHLETSSVLIRQLPLKYLQPSPVWKICPDVSGKTPENELIEVEGGNVKLGKPLDHPLYGWDNEYGKNFSTVSSFRASRFLVSNGEFKSFVDDQGYHREEYWTEEGWSWVQYQKAECPRFWRALSDGSWKLRLMLEEVEMPWSWPVEVNYLEAKAFCNWKSKKTGTSIRLPMEEEWHRLIDCANLPDVLEWSKSLGNLNLEKYASPCPVNHHAFGNFYDLFGNAWQWTETPISGYKGFKVHPWYDDFSTPTFDTQHNLIKGGSWISTGNEITRHARYAFRRHFYQHAGFRYIETEAPVVIKDDRYETDPEVCQYCESHYGSEEKPGENYAEKIAQIAMATRIDQPKKKALHFGCKTGRTAFELAVEFDQVLGLDLSARTIKVGVTLQKNGYLRYTHPQEGEIMNFREVQLKDLGLYDVREKVQFQQSDPANMKSIYKGFDLLIADQVLENCHHPEKFLHSLEERILPQGTLIISSNYNWDTKYTPKDKWLGGYRDEHTGENVKTLDSIKDILSPKFELQQVFPSIPFVLPHNQRRIDSFLCEVTIWGRVNS